MDTTRRSVKDAHGLSVSIANSRCAAKQNGFMWGALPVNSALGLRGQLVTADVSGRASVVWRESAHLPYADAVVNLLVDANWSHGAIATDEILRVRTPGGIGVIGNDAKPGEVTSLQVQLKKLGVTTFKVVQRPGWISFVNPIDPELGEWTHLRAGADQSYVGNDKVVGPWKEIRWIADPRWGSLYTSYGGLVTAGGRLYYKENRAAVGGSQTHLVARDAYNGCELWQTTSGAIWERTQAYIDYTLTCDDQRVYQVEGEKLVAREGKDGQEFLRYELGFVPKTVTVAGDYLLASTRGRATAVHKETGEVAWQLPAISHPAAADGTNLPCRVGQGQGRGHCHRRG